RFCPRRRGHRRAGRAEVCRHGHVPFRLRAGALPGTILIHQFVQPVGGPDQAGRGVFQEVAAAGRRTSGLVIFDFRLPIWKKWSYHLRAFLTREPNPLFRGSPQPLRTSLEQSKIENRKSKILWNANFSRKRSPSTSFKRSACWKSSIRIESR